MKIIEISADQLERAEDTSLKKTLKNSIKNGKGNDVGRLGEIMVFDFFKEIKCRVVDKSKESFDYDLIINGKKIEVKTKTTSVIPKGYFNCSVNAANATQKCDYYFFVRINIKTWKECYLLGYISKKEFDEKCFFAKKGEIDYGKPFPVDCYNIKISDIIKFKFDK